MPVLLSSRVTFSPLSSTSKLLLLVENRESTLSPVGTGDDFLDRGCDRENSHLPQVLGDIAFGIIACDHRGNRVAAGQLLKRFVSRTDFRYANPRRTS